MNQTYLYIYICAKVALYITILALTHPNKTLRKSCRFLL